MDGPQREPQNGPQAAFSIGVKFCACAGIVAAPREVWASALKASEPTSRIAAVAMKVTFSLRFDCLPVALIARDSKRHNFALRAKDCQLKFFNAAGNRARPMALPLSGRRIDEHH